MKLLERIKEFNERIRNLIPKKYSLILSILFFLSVMFAFHSYIGTFKHLSDRPCSVHVWAQTARASVALNYYRGDMNFFKPHVHRYLKGEGVTGMEFPLVSYVPAICYKLFGFDEKYYRGFVLITFLGGLLFFFLLINKLVRNWLVACGLTLSASCSPVFLFYGINFMPDITSLALVLGSWFFFFRYVQEGYHKRDLNFFCLCAALAALIKLTSLVALLTVFALVLLDYLKFFKKYNDGKLFPNKTRVLFSLFISSLAIVSWYAYTAWLTSTQGQGAFIMSPAIVTDSDTFNWVWGVIKKDHKFEYYPYETYMFILSALALLIVAFKYVDRLAFTVFLITTLGNMALTFLFFYQFKDHDYYIVTLTSSVFLLYYVFAGILKKIETRFALIGPILVFILFFNLKEGVNYSKRVFVDRFSKDFLYYFDNSPVYNDLEPKLRKLGIKRTDRTLCFFDEHWSAGLYKMDQLGYSLMRQDSIRDFDSIMAMPEFKYLVLTDTVMFNRICPNKLHEKIIGSHRGLLIYKLK